MSSGQPFSTGEGLTVKSVVLGSVPPAVVTEILPVVAPTGTTALICVSDEEETLAEVPLNVTEVGLLSVVPVMVTLVPAAPEVGVKLVIFGETMKLAGLGSLVPLGVVTRILPVVAPAGTVAVIWVSESTLNAEAAAG